MSDRVMLEITAPLRDDFGHSAETCAKPGCGAAALGVVDSPFSFPRGWCVLHLGEEVVWQIELAYVQRSERDSTREETVRV